MRSILRKGNTRKAIQAIRNLFGKRQTAFAFYHATSASRIRQLASVRYLFAAQLSPSFRPMTEEQAKKCHVRYQQDVRALQELDAGGISTMSNESCAELVRQLDASIEAEAERLLSFLPLELWAAIPAIALEKAREEECVLAAWAGEVRRIEAAHAKCMDQWEQNRAACWARARNLYQELLQWEERPSLCRSLQACFGGRESGDGAAEMTANWVSSDPAKEISRGGLFELLCRLYKRMTYAYRVFISYRRDSGADRAQLIARELRRWGWRFRTFLDVKSLGGGQWDEQIRRAIEEARGLIVVLTPGSVDPRPEEDVMRWEFEYAEQFNRRVVPVFDEKFRTPKNPEEWVERLLSNQGVAWHHDVVDHCLEQIVRYLG